MPQDSIAAFFCGCRVLLISGSCLRMVSALINFLCPDDEEFRSNESGGFDASGIDPL
tara:strand:+ start:588 stop:758 length:171 start_codon:yes stop_codon:yes gene_type:complete